MPALNDLALAVEERETGQFFWTLLEALDSGTCETLDYQVLRSAAKPQTSYSSALALGAAELWKIGAAAGSARHG